MDDREQFIKSFIQKGQQSGASREDITSKLESALKEYDGGLGLQPIQQERSFTEELTRPTNIGAAIGDIAGGDIGPVAAGLAGVGAFAGRLYEDVQDEQPLNFGEATKEAGVSAAIAGVTPRIGQILAKPAGKILSKAAKPVKEFLAKQAEDIVLKGIKVSPTGQQAFKDLTRTTIPKFIQKFKLTGDPLPRAEKLIAQKQADFDKIAIKSGISVPIDDVVKGFQKRIAELTSGISEFFPDEAKLAQQLTEDATNFVKVAEKQGLKEIPVEMLTKIRRFADTKTTHKQFLANFDTASINVQKRRILNEVIQEATKGIKAGGKTLKEIGMELRDLNEFMRVAGKTPFPSALSRLSPLLTKGGFGVAGGIVGGVPGAVAGVGLDVARRSPQVLGGISKGLKSASEATLPKIPQAVQRGLRTIPQFLVNP